MATTLPVGWIHTANYFSKGIDARGPYYKVEYMIADYADTDLMVNAMLGKVTLSGTTVSYVGPHQHPLSPNLLCQSAEVVDGLGGPQLNAAGFPYYKGQALIRAEYRAPTWDAEAAPEQSFDAATPVVYATQELDYGTETYTTPAGVYGFVGSGLPTNIPIKYTIGITQMVLTYVKLPYLPMGVVRRLRNRVNSQTFLGADPGCVLFRGAKTHRDFNTDGSILQQVQLAFDERDSLYPWNSAPGIITPSVWEPIADAGGAGSGPYTLDDLSPLVQLMG
jgi:hypothetical protein